MNSAYRSMLFVLFLVNITLSIAHQAFAQGSSPLSSVTGTVTNEAGQPIAGAEILVGPGSQARAISDVKGTFQLRLSPGTYQVTGYLAGYTPMTQEITVQAGETQRISITLSPVKEQILAEIDVTAGYAIDRNEPVAVAALSSEEVLDLPNFGNDLFRAVAAIPGVSSGEASAQFNVRGGLARDTSILIDGLEIYEPYHVKDFQGGIFSIIDPDVIGSLNLVPGGFTAEYGDKMAGILNMGMAQPGPDFSGHIGVSISSFWASGNGSFGADDDKRYRFSLRRGFLDLVPNTADDEGESSSGTGPQYWDVIGKIEIPLSESHSFNFSLLSSDDSIESTETELDDFGFAEMDSVDSSYGNSYAWMTHQGLLSDRLFVDSLLSAGRVDRDRRATEDGFEASASIHDVRTMDVFNLRQDWNFELSNRHFLKWGFEARSFDVDYDYSNEFAIGGPLGGNSLTRFVDTFSAENYSAYLADRARLGPNLVAELGVRYDQQSLTDETQVSPRLNLVWDLGSKGLLRAAVGRYHQSQRPNELQVEDGETQFFPAESADTVLLGWERNFGSINLRLDAYNRDVSDPRPYYTNIFEATNPNPEITRDRILVAPETSNARGIELFLSRRTGKRFNWWASYSWSEITDRINGRDIPRSYDQPHALSLSGTYRLGRNWTLTALFNYHTGWPTTALSGRAVTDANGDVSIEPVLGPRNDERLDDYHRLDLRVGRFVELRNDKSLEFFIDIQNLYGRNNVAGFIVDDRNFTLLPSGEVEYTPVIEEWLGVLPSFGVGFRF